MTLVHPLRTYYCSFRILHRLRRNQSNVLCNQDVFQTVAVDTIDSCLSGFSGTILAYGQTNSGKTWTVTGGEGFEERGLAPRAIGHLFREIRNGETSELSVSYEVGRAGTSRPVHGRRGCGIAAPSVAGHNSLAAHASMTALNVIPSFLVCHQETFAFSRPIKVRASYLEVYEGRVYDLLDVSNRDKPMEEWATVTPLDDGEGNQVLKGLTTFEVDNEGENECTQKKAKLHELAVW